MNNSRAARAWLIFALIVITAFAWCSQARAQELLGEAPPAPERTLDPNAPFLRLGDPETGALLLKSSEDGLYLEAPRVATDANLTVAGPIVRARITQRFENPSENWVEGVYVFPLPTDAGVDTLKIQIGDRFIEGEIKERQEARQIYEDARAEGRRAGLVEQERPNMFTTSVANIGPGETVVVQIEYQDRARLQDGTWSLRLPLVVGPRYLPMAQPFLAVTDRGPAFGVNDPVPDRARITPVVMHPDDEPGVSRPGAMRLPVNIEAEIAPGFALDGVASPYHAVSVDYGRERDSARVTLADGDIPADRDFVLEWRAAQAGPVAQLFTETVGTETYVMGVIAPPAAPQADPNTRPIRETIFVIDNSGSMAGQSMEEAKAALLHALDGLTEDDWFNIIRFDNTVEKMAPIAIAADARSVSYARAFVRRLEAEGGTEMLPALEAALEDPMPGPTRVRQVVFLTDGAIGNEAQLFSAIQGGLGRSRLFTVGIGSAPNTYFMSRAARMGRGTFLHIGDVGEVEEKAAQLFRALENPVLTDLDMFDPAGALVETWPAPLPDLYSGEPVTFTARLRPEARTAQISIAGLRGGEEWETVLNLADAKPGAGVAKLWARDKIAAIEEQRFWREANYQEIDAAVLNVALQHHLVSRLTSLVAVDATPARPAGERLASGEVPTMLPAGWDFGKVFETPSPQPEPDPSLQDASRADAYGTQYASLAASPAPGSADPSTARDRGLLLPQTAALAGARVGWGVILLVIGLLAFTFAANPPRKRPARARGDRRTGR